MIKKVINEFMPGVRKEGQKFVGIWCEASLLEKINEARGDIPISQFLRDAISEKLIRMGKTVQRFEVVAPDRSGKGGPKKAPFIADNVIPNLPKTAEASSLDALQAAAQGLKSKHKPA